ncbi:aromatic ring-hydroxylating dioxygenase subunit alpha [Marinobacter salarius]|uniref:aromatic ring-hydroxylating oxygenase subunit alpha n=1 Tax=Marinobacter salarius TaxID=1420917 RepID=UPI00273CB963|nr:aromatic ring-hydroxylating dioxygenase subunit alpha [Marinobacter salarius]MDP4533522.1 aromatic ring-hydroxylating dioxygenase subunit alpha [Marinobacter salarius]
MISRDELSEIKEKLIDNVVVDGEGGIKLGARNIYTDEALFSLEMRYLFHSNWVFVAHESQLPKPHDFFTTQVGLQPILLTRSKDGEVEGFFNACAHRGARICREKSGNKKVHMCRFHGWCYNSGGDLINVTDEEKGAYPPGFSKQDYGLTPVPKLASYRGFIFVSLSNDVEDLDEYLGDVKTLIDLIVDQSETGSLEVLPGETSYSVSANWKLAIENGLDGYHVGTVHGNYIQTTRHRSKKANELKSSGQNVEATQNLDVSSWGEGDSGFLAFRNGHGLLYSPYPNYQTRPAYEQHEKYCKLYGETKADWITKKIRNLMIMPNVFFMDQMSSQIRIVRPVSVNRTETITYCIAPVGESVKARKERIRQYEDFFNASGMATPDDLTEFRNCQIGYMAEGAPWNDLSRGQTRWVPGTNDSGKSLGIEALSSGLEAADEGVYISILEEWAKKMRQGISKDLEQEDLG